MWNKFEIQVLNDKGEKLSFCYNEGILTVPPNGRPIFIPIEEKSHA